MKLNEIYRPSQARAPRHNPTASVVLVLEHPDFTGNEDDLFAEPTVNVEFTVDPGDPSTGWRGGADEIQEITADEAFDFMGQHYEVGQKIPEEVLQYWSPHRGYKKGDVYDYLLQSAYENADSEEDDGDYELDRRRDEEYDRY